MLNQDWLGGGDLIFVTIQYSEPIFLFMIPFFHEKGTRVEIIIFKMDHGYSVGVCSFGDVKTTLWFSPVLCSFCKMTPTTAEPASQLPSASTAHPARLAPANFLHNLSDSFGIRTLSLFCSLKLQQKIPNRRAAWRRAQ